MSKNVSNIKKFNKNKKFSSWNDTTIKEAFRIFNTNSHQIFYSDENYKTNKTYFNINKCGRVKKKWTCHYYSCLPCMFEYLNHNYQILRDELKPKLKGRYTCHLITYRIPLLNDDLTTNYKLLIEVIDKFKHSEFVSTNYEKFLEEIGYVSSITSFECPFSYAVNMHILHAHECLIARNQITKKRNLEIEKSFNSDYQNAILSTYNKILGGNNFELAYNFTHETGVYNDEEHYKAVQLVRNFNSIEYLANPFKLLRGFETLLDKSIQIDTKKTVSPYLNCVYSFNRPHYLNFVDNLPNKLPKPFEDLAVSKTINYNSSPTYQSVWLSYGNIEDLDLREYFRLDKFKDLTLQEIRQMKEDTQIQKIISYRKGKYAEIISEFDNLLKFIHLRFSLNVLDLNEKLKTMKRKEDVIYMVTLNNRYYQFKIGFYSGYINALIELDEKGIREMRQLVNHENSDLPEPQTDSELIADVARDFEHFLNSPNMLILETKLFEPAEPLKV